MSNYDFNYKGNRGDFSKGILQLNAIFSNLDEWVPMASPSHIHLIML